MNKKKKLFINGIFEDFNLKKRKEMLLVYHCDLGSDIARNIDLGFSNYMHSFLTLLDLYITTNK